MTCGIYCYIDTVTNRVVYIGKDSYLDKEIRRYQHLSKYRYNQQPFNRILQNNPKRYEYKILKQGDFSNNLLSALEIIYIRRYKTYRPQTNNGWNFTIGGEGSLGYKHTKESKKKMSLWQKDRKLSLQQKINISKARNTTGYYRVTKEKDKTCKQGFIWRYEYYEDGKSKKIRSVDIDKLRRKVVRRGLKWVKY